MGNTSIVDITENNWQSEVLDSNVPVLVDFWAEWCAPCKMIAPVIDQLAEELSGKFKFVKVDVEQNSALAEKFHIRSIPSLIVIKNGSVQEQMVGVVREEDLKAKLNAYI